MVKKIINFILFNLIPLLLGAFIGLMILLQLIGCGAPEQNLPAFKHVSTSDTSWIVEVKMKNMTEMQHYAVYKDDTLLIGLSTFWKEIAGIIFNWDVRPDPVDNKRVQVFLMEANETPEKFDVKEYFLPQQRHEFEMELRRYTDSGYGGFELYNEINNNLIPTVYHHIFVRDSVMGYIKY